MNDLNGLFPQNCFFSNNSVEDIRDLYIFDELEILISVNVKAQTKFILKKLI